MARPSATAAALLLLVVPLLAVAHCRPIEADTAESTPAIPSSEEDGQPNPTLHTDAMVLPAEEQHQLGGFLRLPSHRHRPCRHGHGLLHRHLWWARHHGVFGDAPLRFRSADGESRAFFPAVESQDTTEAEEVKAVAEPDPDRSIQESEGEAELGSAEPSFRDADGAHEAAAHDDEGEAVRAWKKEMLRRWIHFHHGMRHHHRHHDDKAEDEAAGEGIKRFDHRRRHGDEEDEEKNTMRKRFRPAEHDDSDDDEVEEMVRRFRKAILRRRSFGHGRRFHHHRHHHGQRHAEKADGEEEGGVMAWIKGLANRF